MSTQEVFQQADFVGLHYAFAETEHGQRLASAVRYSVYKPDSVSNERWQALLGIDVNNLGHLKLSDGLAKSFIRNFDRESPGSLSEDDKSLLRVAALTHDWAESVVGDTNYGDKTAHHEAAEQLAFEQNLSAFCNGRVSDAEELVQRALSEIIFSPSTRLGQMFNAIERVGYMRTALRASSHVIEGSALDCTEALRWLVADVLGHHPPVLIDYANQYPPVRLYLENQRSAITSGFQIIKPDTFDNYAAEKHDKKKQSFEASKTIWHQWRVKTKFQEFLSATNS